MPITSKMNPRGLEDIIVAPVTQDNAAGYTVGNYVRLEDSQALNISYKTESVSQKARNKEINKSTKVTGATLQVQFGAQALEAFRELFGGKYTTSGSSPTEQAKYEFQEDDEPGFFQLIGRSDSLNDASMTNADATYTFWKCKVESGDLGAMAQDQFAEPSITVGAEFTENASTFTNSKKSLLELLKRETGTALSTTTDAVAPTATLVPADTATGIAVGADLTVTWDEPIMFDAADYSVIKIISATDTVEVAATVTYDGSSVVTINPTANLDATSNYQLMAKGVKDLAGNAALTYISNFTTA